MNVFLIETTCSECGTKAELPCQFKGYGQTNAQAYRMGDKILSSIPRDRILRYVPLNGPGLCSRCGHLLIPDPRFLIVRRDVIESLYSFPESSAAGPAYRIFYSGMKEWETMNLVKEYGLERIASLCEQLADKKFQPGWKLRLEEYLNAYRRAQSEAAAGVVEKVVDVSKLPKNDFALNADLDLILDHLAGMGDHAPYAPNILSHDFECSGCNRKDRWEIPFNYGTCNGYRYEIQDKIDWSKLGHIPTVRDAELRYIEIGAPACRNCGLRPIGMVTVLADKICDIFIWPKELWDLIQMPPVGMYPKGSGWVLSHLTEYLIVREFGSDVRQLDLELRYAEWRRHPHAPGTFPASPGSHHVYESLKAIYQQRRGKTYDE